MKIKTIVGILVFTLFFGAGFFWMNRDFSMAASQTGVVVVNDVLNVRTGAGTNYAKLQSDGADVKLPNGTKVTIVETLSGWYKVSFVYNSKTLTGYVSAQYVAVETTATATPTPTSTPGGQIVYRYETSYKKISVPAKISKATKVYKSAAGKQLTVSKEAVTLAKKKKVTLVGEKTVNNKKWFKVSFTHKKKKRTGYIQNTYVKMTLAKKASAAITKNKKTVKVRTKADTKAAYKKVNKKTVKLAKKTAVEISKEKTVNGVKWYKLTFTYNGKSYSGYLKASYVNLAKKKVTKKVVVTTLSDAQFEKVMTVEGFPESYKQSLRVLHHAYPYWQFKAYKTGLDWNTVLDNESKPEVNLISNSKSKAWKSTEAWAYNAKTGKWKVFDGDTWVAASRQAIAYYLDPRNFLTDKTVFQFELLEYQSQYQIRDGVNTILSNTPFYNKKFTYKDLSTGKDKSIYYVDAFMAAAKESGVSPYHLASRVKQEVVTSATTTSSAVTGTHATYPGIYNFYNIGATSSSNPVANGLKWASTGSTYLRPWTDRYRSIVGGGMYIGSSYINKGQNTVYLEKFNVTSYQRYTHQYMTNVEAAYSEAIKTKNAYAGTMDKTPLVFAIPVYDNMPAANCPMPK